MIGKNMTGRSFGGCLRYVLNRKEAVILETEGVRGSNTAAMIYDFNMQRELNPNLGKAVGHLVLSWHQHDLLKLSPPLMAERAREYMKLMEIRDTQYTIVQHTDRNNPHLHIVYNRVDNNGKTITDQNNYKRNEKACKALTEKYGYYYGKGKEQVNRDRLKGKEKLRYQLFDAITLAAKTAKNWQQLEATLKCQGIGLEYKYKSGSTTEVQGISFSKGRIKLKGSAIDRALSYTNMDKQLRQNRRTQQQTESGLSSFNPFNQKNEEQRQQGQLRPQEQLPHNAYTGDKEKETEIDKAESGEPASRAPALAESATQASETQAHDEQFSWLESWQELGNAFGSAPDVDDDAMRRKRRSRSR